MRKEMAKQKTPHLSLYWYVGTPRLNSSLEEMLWVIATTLIYLRGRTCRRRVTTLSTVSLEAELVSMTMTDLRSFIIPCKITITSLDCPRAPDLSWHSSTRKIRWVQVRRLAAPRDIRPEADESALEVHLMLIEGCVWGAWWIPVLLGLLTLVFKVVGMPPRIGHMELLARMQRADFFWTYSTLQTPWKLPIFLTFRCPQYEICPDGLS